MKGIAVGIHGIKIQAEGASSTNNGCIIENKFRAAVYMGIGYGIIKSGNLDAVRFAYIQGAYNIVYPTYPATSLLRNNIPGGIWCKFHYGNVAAYPITNGWDHINAGITTVEGAILIINISSHMYRCIADKIKRSRTIENGEIIIVLRWGTGRTAHKEIKSDFIPELIGVNNPFP